jgi:hypothetical protein
MEALEKEDSEVKELHKRQEMDKDSEERTYGRETQLKEVKTLLAKDPHQVILVAGANESGKSHFVLELLRGIKRVGVTHIQLAHLVDSVSTFTYSLVNHFDLRWLKMRYSLIDVLPFAGSEILVMKERFSDRDLAQALRVITEALKRHASSSLKYKKGRPVIVIDGLAEGDAWARTYEGKQCLQRLFQWCIYVTKERQLAHVILTGNEKLMLSLTDQNRLTRGHIRVVSLRDLSDSKAREMILNEIPDAADDEIEKIISNFGGFVHDIRGICRDIQGRLGHLQSSAIDRDTRSQIMDEVISTRYWLQVERVTAAFAKGRDSDDDNENDTLSGIEEEEEMDPFLDPLKSQYSEAQASQKLSARMGEDLGNDPDTATYTKLQLWQSLQRLMASKDKAISFAELRDDVFDHDKAPLLRLMDDDVLGFEIERSVESENSWKVKPATPALSRAFEQIVLDGSLKKRFQKLERRSKFQEKIRQVKQEQFELQKERRELEKRKASINSTIVLGEKLGRRRAAQTSLTNLYDSILAEECNSLIKDNHLRDKLKFLKEKLQSESASTEDLKSFYPLVNDVQNDFKKAISQSMPSYKNQRSTFWSKLSFPGPSHKPDLNDLWSTFVEMDSKKSGTFDAEDVVRFIRNHTGKEVDIEAARRLIYAWDVNDDDEVDFEEFSKLMALNNENDKQEESNIISMIKRATKKS